MDGFRQEIVMLLAAALATLGYSILFRLKPSRLPFAIIGGIIATAMYIIMKRLVDNDFVANFIAAVIVTIYSEVCASLLKAPATVFLFPSNIPLVPGGALYWAMDRLLRGNIPEFLSFAATASQTGLGIALGIVIASLGAVMIRRIRAAKRNASAQNSQNQ